MLLSVYIGTLDGVLEEKLKHKKQGDKGDK